MNYIEISKGLSVRIDQIEAIGYGNGDLTSKIYTHHNTYESKIPYNVILSLVENKKTDRNQELNIMKTIGNYVG